MVLPEGLPGRSRTPRLGKGALAGVALFVAVLGAVALWGLTAPDGEATPTTVPSTTTTSQVLDPPIDFDNFSVDQIATGEPLDWELVASITEQVPHSLVVHDGVAYAFGYEASGPVARPRALSAWRSIDSGRWEPAIGQPTPRVNPFLPIQATPQGLLTIAESANSTSLWRSTNGRDWTTIDLPDLGSAGSGQWGWATANEEVIVIAITDNVDQSVVVEDRLLDYIGLETLSDSMWISWTFGLEDLRFELRGPFNLRLAEVTGTELELTEDEDAAARESMSSPGRVRLFGSSDRGVTWIEATSESSWIDSLHTLPDGSIIAVSQGPNGQSTIRTLDGVNWVEVDGFGPREVITWREGLAGTSGRDIRTSTDGVEWMGTDLDELIPWRLNWRHQALAGGAGGIATVLVADNGLAEPFSTEPLVVERDEALFEFDLFRSLVTATDGANTYEWESFNPRVEVSFENRIMSFVSDDGRVIGTFGIDELERLQQDAFARPPEIPIDRHVAFVTSRDAKHWNVQPVPEEFGPYGPSAVALTEDRVVALVPTDAGLFTLGNGGFEIWTALIP